MAPNSFLIIFGIVTAVSGTIVQPEWKIYYNLTTRKEFDIIDSNNPRFQFYKSKSTAKILRIGFGPIPCDCHSLTCGCCTGMNIRYFNFDRTACMNFTYDPYEFSLSMDMLMNDDSLFAQSISGKNPPPACLPVIIPYGPPVDFCIRLFNIHTPGQNLFMCMDFETRITRAPVLILHFDCLQMGVDGIHHYKPEDALTGPEVEEEETQSPSDIEVYDEVFEEDGKNSTMGGGKTPEKKDGDKTQESKENDNPTQKKDTSVKKQETIDTEQTSEISKNGAKEETKQGEQTPEIKKSGIKQETKDSEQTLGTNKSDTKHGEQIPDEISSTTTQEAKHSEQTPEIKKSGTQQESKNSEQTQEIKKSDAKHSEQTSEKKNTCTKHKTTDNEKNQGKKESDTKKEKKNSDAKQEEKKQSEKSD